MRKCPGPLQSESKGPLFPFAIPTKRKPWPHAVPSIVPSLFSHKDQWLSISLVQTWTVAVLIGSLWNCIIILIVELEEIQLCGTQKTEFTGMHRNGIHSTYLATFLFRNATVCVTYVIVWWWFRRIKKERVTLAEKIQKYFKFRLF